MYSSRTIRISLSKRSRRRLRRWDSSSIAPIVSPFTWCSGTSVASGVRFRFPVAGEGPVFSAFLAARAGGSTAADIATISDGEGLSGFGTKLSSLSTIYCSI